MSSVKNPSVKSLLNVPKVREWIKSRPDTEVWIYWQRQGCLLATYLLDNGIVFEGVNNFDICISRNTYIPIPETVINALSKRQGNDISQPEALKLFGG